MKHYLGTATVIMLCLAAMIVYANCQVDPTVRPSVKVIGDRPNNDWLIVYVADPYGDNPVTKQEFVEARTYDEMIVLFRERVNDPTISIRCITRAYYYTCEYRPAEG